MSDDAKAPSVPALRRILPWLALTCVGVGAALVGIGNGIGWGPVAVGGLLWADMALDEHLGRRR